MNKQKESKIYSDPGLSLADKLNLDRIRELNDRRTAYLREAELNQPSVIDGGDFHGEKLMRDTKKLPYIASKGTVKELEEYFENHPAFNWDLENPEDFDREEKRVEELRKVFRDRFNRCHFMGCRPLRMLRRKATLPTCASFALNTASFSTWITSTPLKVAFILQIPCLFQLHYRPRISRGQHSGYAGQ